jgi:hypothetical protein
MIERDLFGTVRLVHNWGRIGTNGQELVEVFANECEAGQALKGLARGEAAAGVSGSLAWQLTPMAQASEFRRFKTLASAQFRGKNEVLGAVVRRILVQVGAG